MEHKLSTLVSEGSQGSLDKAGQARQRTVKIVDGTGTGTRTVFTMIQFYYSLPVVTVFATVHSRYRTELTHGNFQM